MNLSPRVAISPATPAPTHWCHIRDEGRVHAGGGRGAVKFHSQHGARLVVQSALLQHGVDVVLVSHERLGGTTLLLELILLGLKTVGNTEIGMYI